MQREVTDSAEHGEEHQFKRLAKDCSVSGDPFHNRIQNRLIEERLRELERSGNEQHHHHPCQIQTILPERAPEKAEHLPVSDGMRGHG